MFADSHSRSEIKVLWKRLGSLEKSYESSQEKIKELETQGKAAPISQKEAATAARSAAQYNGKIKRISMEVHSDYENIKKLHEELLNIKEESISLNQLSKEHMDECSNTQDSTQETCEAISSLYAKVTSEVEQINEIISNNEGLSEQINNTNALLEESESAASKVQSIFKSIVAIRSKISDVYDEINGYEVDKVNENDEVIEGETTRVEGLKEELASSYEKLTKDMIQAQTELDKLSSNTKEGFDKVLDDSSAEFTEFIKKCDKTFEDVNTEITELLPKALTAGLSAAYDEKKVTEEVELDNSLSTFNKAILGLVCISLIPFSVDIYLFAILKQELVTVISDTPKLLISILPLYFPILWIAYSANKKANLSKRLIEEYTHKGVLSKTFEGLSKQIENIKEPDLSSELRVKLLFNLLEVNSENPGKLISNYNTSDHPLIDALEKSSKLSSSVEKLANIPGFSALVKRLDKQGRKVLDITNKKVAVSLEVDDTNQTSDEVKDKKECDY